MKMHELNTNEPYSGVWAKIDHELMKLGYPSGRDAIDSWGAWGWDVSDVESEIEIHKQETEND